MYYYVEVEKDGVKELKLQYDCIGYKFNNIAELLEAGEACINKYKTGKFDKNGELEKKTGL